MRRTIDYYFSVISSYSYLGGERFAKLVEDYDLNVNMYPVDISKVFAATGGLPVKQRAPERQAYRLIELRRWSEYLQVPFVLEPKYFPTNATPASLLMIAAIHTDVDALALSHAVLRAVWAEERNIAEIDILLTITDELGIDGKSLLEQSKEPDIAKEYQTNTEMCIARGVFGFPTYIIDDEPFWGQDRLEFVERKLQSKAV